MCGNVWIEPNAIEIGTWYNNIFTLLNCLTSIVFIELFGYLVFRIVYHSPYSHLPYTFTNGSPRVSHIFSNSLRSERRLWTTNSLILNGLIHIFLEARQWVEWSGGVVSNLEYVKISNLFPRQRNIWTNTVYLKYSKIIFYFFILLQAFIVNLLSILSDQSYISDILRFL